MRFSRLVLFSSSLLLAGFIVVRAASPVNHNTDQKKLQLVDGAPLPPPHADANSTLFADGAPLPPPHLDGGAMLLADGAPLPPPHSDGNTMLLADGAPLPPPHQAIESGVAA
jgi:hypothetical protein